MKFTLICVLLKNFGFFGIKNLVLNAVLKPRFKPTNKKRSPNWLLTTKT